jgi:hypothetical protein
MSYNYPPLPRRYQPETHSYPNPSSIDEPRTLPVQIVNPNVGRPLVEDDILSNPGSYYRSPTQHLRSPSLMNPVESYGDHGGHGHTGQPEEARFTPSSQERRGPSILSERARDSREQQAHHHRQSLDRHHHHEPTPRRQHRSGSFSEEESRYHYEARSRERQRSIEQATGYYPAPPIHHGSLPHHMSHQFGSLPPQLAMGHAIVPPGPSMVPPGPTMGGPMMGEPQEGGPMDYATLSAMSGNNVRMNPFANPHTAYPNAMPLSNSIDIPPVVGYGAPRYRSFAKPGTSYDHRRVREPLWVF